MLLPFKQRATFQIANSMIVIFCKLDHILLKDQYTEAMHKQMPR
jgi:hypothetical protein